MSTDAMSSKRKVLVVGAGRVGAMACVAMERSGMASATAVPRWNYQKVLQDGFKGSVSHGRLSAWWPTRVTPGHTTIILIQNGIYIKPPFIEVRPSNALLSGASYIGAHEHNGHILPDDPDRFHVGSFRNPQLDPPYERQRLEDFAAVYSSSKAVEAEIVSDILHYRWRKLLWNGVFNPTCATTQLDSAAIRQFNAGNSLIRPGMAEMAVIAKSDGYDLGEGIVDEMVDVTPIELSFRPSMLIDMDKENPLESEVILGNALRVARKNSVDTPILDNTYRMLKLVLARLLAAQGYIREPKEIPMTDFI
ncbi:uncharacterized protein N7498_001354 [Penicillium cinerascens]|uniref:Ketopantoate reductase C-terminal domain-containing protein n=1 Tax=Penicillium cinerascens TaxID=70096 RepID=A0A9W9NFY0_9EURO|nr:uncharacterized protein N7498_001354 [Penicillium cinerascens]KAJ5219255.1 hypothetical protein N7498_001354 [Penicillium cinerascens]